MLLLLDARRGERVLDVGSGSGWTTALLASLVGSQGRVLGVELEPALVARSRETLARQGLAPPWVRIEQAAPGMLGWPASGPFDRVLVSADAGPQVPAELVAQVARGGRMVIPVAGRLLRIDVTLDGEAQVSTHGAYRFVPLRT